MPEQSLPSCGKNQGIVFLETCYCHIVIYRMELKTKWQGGCLWLNIQKDITAGKVPTTPTCALPSHLPREAGVHWLLSLPTFWNSHEILEGSVLLVRTRCLAAKSMQSKQIYPAYLANSQNKVIKLQSSPRQLSPDTH